VRLHGFIAFSETAVFWIAGTVSGGFFSGVVSDTGAGSGVGLGEGCFVSGASGEGEGCAAGTPAGSDETELGSVEAGVASGVGTGSALASGNGEAAAAGDVIIPAVGMLIFASYPVFKHRTCSHLFNSPRP